MFDPRWIKPLHDNSCIEALRNLLAQIELELRRGNLRTEDEETLEAIDQARESLEALNG